MFWLAFLQIAASILFYPYMRIGEFQATRFLFLPVACFSILAADEFALWVRRVFAHFKLFVFHVIFGVVVASNLYQSWGVLEVYGKEAKEGVKTEALSSVARWVAARTQAEDLVAVSEYIIGGVYLDRPTVVLPLYKTLSYNKLSSFLDIYAPRVVVFEKTLPMGAVLREKGYQPVSGWSQRSLFLIFEKVAS